MPISLQPIVLKKTAAPPNPAVGNVVLYSVDGTVLLMRDEFGVVRTIGPSAGAGGNVANAAVATPAAGFAADTYLAGSGVLIPAGRLQAKSLYRCRFSVSKTAAGVAAPIVNVRIGTAGTTADATRSTLTHAVQTAVIDEGLFEVLVTFRTVGAAAAATVQSTSVLSHRLSVTGLSTSVTGTIVGAVSAGFDSTVAGLIIGLSVNGGTSAAWTIATVQAELSNLA